MPAWAEMAGTQRSALVVEAVVAERLAVRAGKVATES
jgi:hypothetical protein